MDRVEKATNLVKVLARYNRGELKDYQLVNSVCEYFDIFKEKQLKQADYKFLKYISNISGIPHFFDILGDRFKHNTEFHNIDLNTFSCLFYESSLHTDEKSKLHKYQKEILDKFSVEKLNRFFLSASTSFGKTHIVFEIIKKMQYNNILLIFPTIALLSENLDRLLSDDRYSYFNYNYKIHTLSEVKELGDKNIFIYTPERYLSFIENNVEKLTLDFLFVDEIYKIDNDYLIDEKVHENERDVAYRLAIFYSMTDEIDVLLAGPYIEFSKTSDENYNNSFDNFLKYNSIKLLNYNQYEIVNKSYTEIKTAKLVHIDDALSVEFKSNSKTARLASLLLNISKIGQNTIVYCSTRGKGSGVEYYAEKLIELGVFHNYDYSKYLDLIKHISSNFSSEWILVKALKNGIGIHHGLIPKYLQKEIILLFNRGLIKTLISTTTITEGVNTSAKNMIVLQSKKGNKPLKKFDAKNIAGRAGRFGYHYSGRVITLQNDFNKVIESKGEVIKHRNFDIDIPKNEIDLFHSNDDFLNDSDKKKRKNIIYQQNIRHIPDSVISQYKVVNRADKIKIYDNIMDLSDLKLAQIKILIRKINYNMTIDFAGFQFMLDVISPIIINDDLLRKIDNKFTSPDGYEYSVIIPMINAYLKGGFQSTFIYHHEIRKEDVDKAISETSKFVYNTLKYQIVKYLGVFNIMYRYIQSIRTGKEIDEISGLNKLLMKFEYNALTDEGRIASDYGVPKNVLDYFENSFNKRNAIKRDFDAFELGVFHKVDEMIKR